MASAIFVGLSTIDIVYVVDEFPGQNEKVTALSQDVYIGGPATNACITFAHLGATATLVSAVGSHALAASIHSELQLHSIHLIDLNPEFADLPVISSITVNSRGERNVVSANAIRIEVPPPRVDKAALAQASLLLVDGHFMQACLAWASAARERRLSVVLDGGSWKQGSAELLRFVDTVICSVDFLPPGCACEDDVIRYLSSAGVANIAITRGPQPIRFQIGTESGLVPVPSITSVDTMGAGDIFHGAFCHFSAAGKGFAEALAEAAKIAAESCRHRGPREWMKQSNA